jgi:sugar (pentulose or hexulose) kinase
MRERSPGGTTKTQAWISIHDYLNNRINSIAETVTLNIKHVRERSPGGTTKTQAWISIHDYLNNRINSIA